MTNKISTKMQILLGLLLIFFFSSGFHYCNWNYTVTIFISYVLYPLFAFICVINKSKIKRTCFHGIILLMMTLPLLSLLSKYVINGESLYGERSFLLGLLTFCCYFIFQLYNVKEIHLIKLFTYTSIIVFIIQVTQQMFPERALFGIWDKDSELSIAFNDIAELRNGLYRFRIPTICATIFALFYHWQELLKRFKWNRFCIVAMLLVSIYLFLTRQMMVAVLLTILSTFVFSNKIKIKAWMLYGGGILIFLIMKFSDSLFGEFIKQTNNDVNEDNIRMIASGYFWNEIISNPIYTLLGHGHLDILDTIKELYSFYTSDVGLIGEWYLFGIFWLVLYIYILYLLLKKYSNVLPLYIKLFVFCTSLVSIMIFPYRNPFEYFIWSALLYISSLYIDNKIKT